MLIVGRMVSTIGDNLYIIASTWLIYDLTGSTFYAGLAGFLGSVPKLVQFLVGPVVDRRDASNVLVGTELAQLVVILVVPVAFFFDWLNVYILLGIIPFLSTFDQFSNPAQYALLPELIDDEHIPKANSVFSMSYRAIQAGAKSAGGILVSLIGAVLVYVVNAGTFLVSAILFWQISTPNTVTLTDEEDSQSTLREYLGEVAHGISLILNADVVFLLVFASAFCNFVIGMTTAVLPAYSETYGGAEVYGVLYACVGVGLFLGSLIGGEASSISLGYVAAGGFVISGVGWIATVLVSLLPLTLVCFTVAWISLGVYNVSILSALQIGVPNNKLGRVMATSGSLSGVATSLALLVGGAAGDLLGARTVFLVSGVALGGLGSFYLLLPTVRRLPATESIEADEFDV